MLSYFKSELSIIPTIYVKLELLFNYGLLDVSSINSEMKIKFVFTLGEYLATFMETDVIDDSIKSIEWTIYLNQK